MRISRFILLLTCTFSLCAKWAEETLSNMTLRQKIGQCMIIRTVSNFDQKLPEHAALLKEYLPTSNHTYVRMLISEFNVGGAILQLRSTIDQHVQTVNMLQEVSDIPLLIVMDAECGPIQRLDDALELPYNMTLGAIQDEQLIFDMGRIVGEQCRALGIHMNLAPVVDVNTNPLNPVIGVRSFGEVPDDVARKAELYFKGLQSADCAGCVKHGPIDHGDTEFDTHHMLAVVPHAKKRWKEVSSKTFGKLVSAGIDGIMTAHLHVPDYDGREGSTESLSYAIATDLIRNELNFKGIVITDALDMGAVKKNDSKPGELELEAFLAGNDILLCPENVAAAISLIEKEIKKNPALEEDLNKRVLRILRLKERCQLHENRFVSAQHAKELMQKPEALELKHNLYYQSMTLIKNEKRLLPLTTIHDQRVAILIVENEPKEEGREFGKNLQEHYPESIRLSLNRNNLAKNYQAVVREMIEKSDIVVIGVFGLWSYLREKNHKAALLIDMLYLLKESGKKVVVSLFDNPYVASFFLAADAFIMAYETSSDSQKAAQAVILGELKPSGKLPVSISNEYRYGVGLNL